MNKTLSKILLLCIMVMMLVTQLYAQTISVSAPSRVVAGQNFRIVYEIDTRHVSSFTSGVRSNDMIDVLAGPYTSSQSSFKMVNGHTSSSSSITYTYTLYAKDGGTYSVPAARAVVGGKTISSKPLKITVVGSTRSNADRGHSNGRADAEASRDGAVASSPSQDLFIKVIASKRRVHEQEPVLLTYKVYSLVDLTQLEGKMPELTGFHTQEVEIGQQRSFHVENYNGRNYKCVTWSQYVLYPQMTGDLEVPSITFKGIVVNTNNDIDPLDAFLNGTPRYSETRRNIVAPGLTIHVDPLPNRPDNFSGGVGHFTISSQLDKTEVKAGEPMTFRVVVGGSGNLKLIKEPIVNFPKSFERYDAKITDKTRLTANGLEGNMVYDFLVVPRQEGKYDVPPVELTYYDVSQKAYKTIKTQPLTVQVGEGDGTSTIVADYTSTSKQDIRALKSGSATVVQTGEIFFGSLRYWLCLLIPLACFFLLLFIFRKRAIENADIVRMRGKKANKIATKRLQKAYSLMQVGNGSAFYDEVLRALWGYVGDKLNMPVEQLSRDNITGALDEHNVDRSIIETFIEALDECEFERYAPGDAMGNMSKTYHSAMTAIVNIEEVMKNKAKYHHSTIGAKMLLLIVCLLSTSVIQVHALTKAEADTEYKKGNYRQAIRYYEDLLKASPSAELYYNLGNAYFRAENLPQALLAYERAHLLSPGDKDIRYNLELARSKTIDKIAEPDEMFFITLYRSVANSASSDTWAVLSVVCFVMVLIFVLLYLFMPRSALRSTGAVGSIIFLVLFLLCMLFAHRQKQAFLNRDGAIVVVPTVNVKKTPAANSSDECVIHEGTRVRITDKTIKGWLGIELGDGREGWIMEQQVEGI